MTELSPVHPGSTGHPADHAALKVDYDQRHPDAPLPEGWGTDVHQLLAIDYNRTHPDALPTELHALSSGHIAAHNALAAAYNARYQP